MSVTGFNRRRRELADKLEEPAKEENLEDMTKAELLVFAREHGIDGLEERMLKVDLIATIKAVV